MFTGIIEAVGSVTEILRNGQSCRISISEPSIGAEVRLGDSVAVNGVCLTVDALTPSGFSSDVMPETIRRTSLGSLSAGSPVNMELSLPVSGRLGGHVVSGHVDDVGRIAAIEPDENSVRIKITADASIVQMIVPQGSIAVDGVSLTVTETNADGFWVSLIPRTANKTTLLRKERGEAVNLECDVLGKYVRKLLKDEAAARQNITGFCE